MSHINIIVEKTKQHLSMIIDHMKKMNTSFSVKDIWEGFIDDSWDEDTDFVVAYAKMSDQDWETIDKMFI